VSKIYVANATTQRVQFYYRTPTEVNPKTGKMMWSDNLHNEKIVAGSQICLGNGRDFTDVESKLIFEHQARHFGAMRDGDQARGFVGLIFSDKPIAMDRIKGTIVQNKAAAEDRSNRILGATAQSMLDEHTKLAMNSSTPPPQRVELEVAADKSKDIDVGGKGAEATLQGVAPRNRGSRNQAA
jgi:hypothetical protein